MLFPDQREKASLAKTATYPPRVDKGSRSVATRANWAERTQTRQEKRLRDARRDKILFSAVNSDLSSIPEGTRALFSVLIIAFPIEF